MQPEDQGRGSGKPERDDDRQQKRGVRKVSGFRRYHKFTRYVLIPGAISIVVGLLVFFFRRPAMDQLRAWKSDKVIEEADSEYRAGRFMEVHRQLQVALQLAPLNPKVQRLAAKFYTEVNVPEALNHWQIVITAPDASIEDRLAYVDACLKFFRSDLASAELNSLESTISKSPDFLRRVVRYLILVSDFADAVPYAREAQGASPRDEELEYLLGLCLVRSQRAEWMQEGRRILFSIAVASGAQQLPASRELISTGSLTSVEGRQIARAMERRTDLTFADRLEIAGLRMGNDPAERERIARSLGTEIPPKDDEERVAYAAWTLRMQLPRVALSFLNPLGTTNESLIVLRVEALTQTEDWTGLDEALQRDGSLVPPATAAGAKAVRAKAKGENEQVSAILVSAIDAIGNARSRNWTEQLTTLSYWAERSGQTNLAMRSLMPLLQVRSVLPNAGRRILVLATSVDSLELTLPTLRALRNYAPNDKSVQNAFAHVALLLNENIDDAATAAAELLASNPTNVGNRMILAFARFRQGKFPEALETLEEGGLDASTMDPRLKVLVAVIRHGAGQRDAARQLAREISPSALKLEERKLLEMLQ